MVFFTCALHEIGFNPDAQKSPMSLELWGAIKARQWLLDQTAQVVEECQGSQTAENLATWADEVCEAIARHTIEFRDFSSRVRLTGALVSLGAGQDLMGLSARFVNKEDVISICERWPRLGYCDRLKAVAEVEVASKPGCLFEDCTGAFDPGMYSVDCFEASTNGYDGTLMNGFQGLGIWIDFMEHPDVTWLGTINCLYWITVVVLAPILSWAAGKWGQNWLNHHILESDCLIIVKLDKAAFEASSDGEFDRVLFASTSTNPGDEEFADSIKREAMIKQMREDPFVHLIKAVDTDLSGDDAIVGFAKWFIWPEGMPPPPKREWWPGCNVEACDQFHGGVDETYSRWPRTLITDAEGLVKD
ncbi:hypothetical protein CkaCkLH20_05228 [Colletotrichum karsti]|uniref:Uncharacterized protein n=1 Tax=Colletotrichum karsti TaxID=1095194 RepID=A0A9P6LL94_9PEZI|nr:uncharacterized protein CkaCkLH20_05228 [Colletotrichum karsti]KAF9877528.1 hypothetical protein CkaCkLH20_05228 [Colletotrichum karsti]